MFAYIHAACSGAEIAGECGLNELLKLTKYIQGSNNRNSCSNHDENDCRDGDSDAIYFYQQFLRNYIYSFSDKVPDFPTKCKDMTTKYISLDYECIPDSRILKLCESNKTITANEIHILNMDYPSYTGNWKDTNSSKIRSPCHCEVDSTSTSKHAIITVVRSFVLGGFNNIAIKGQHEQCTINIESMEYNVGQEIHNGSLPMGLVYNYANKDGLHYVWFMIKSDNGGNITLNCGESEDTLDETVPEACNVTNNKSMTQSTTTTSIKTDYSEKPGQKPESLQNQ
ncbi:unnamed protein product [Owenia fusiformis]|uniref:Uncharacterized protein n=1 Tax=Owenia fusiformis TaxID=6347 RepID=A0A8S4P1R6_OWEFU|nr:unnamed protein product [Owenia fusiformis]